MFQLIKLILDLFSEEKEKFIQYKKVTTLFDGPRDKQKILASLFLSKAVELNILAEEASYFPDPIAARALFFVSQLLDVWGDVSKKFFSQEIFIEILMQLMQVYDAATLKKLSKSIEEMLSLYKEQGQIDFILTGIASAAEYLQQNKQDHKENKEIVMAVEQLSSLFKKEKPYDLQQWQMFFAAITKIQSIVCNAENLFIIDVLSKLSAMCNKPKQALELHLFKELKSNHSNLYYYYFPVGLSNACFVNMIADAGMSSSPISQYVKKNKSILQFFSCYQALQTMQACLFANGLDAKVRLNLFDKTLTAQHRHFLLLNQEKIDSVITEFLDNAHELLRIVKDPEQSHYKNHTLFWPWATKKKEIALEEFKSSQIHL